MRARGTSTPVFRMTEAGRTELKLQRAGLAMATRSVLILVNGIDDARAFSTQGLADVQSYLDTLAAPSLGKFDQVLDAIESKLAFTWDANRLRVNCKTCVNLVDAMRRMTHLTKRCAPTMSWPLIPSEKSSCP